MHVEKRATNKFGIFILVIAVIGLLAGGGYYLYKNKGKINFNITLPWQKSETKELDNANDKNGKKGNENRSFVAPVGISNTELKTDRCVTEFKSIEDKTKEIVFKFSTTNLTTKARIQKTVPCELNIYKVAVDGFLVPGEVKMRLEGDGQKEDGQLVIKKSDLESNEIYGMEDLTLFYKVTELRDNSENEFIEVLKVTNDRSVKHETKGVLIAEFNNVNVYYYKTIADNENNYIYFILDNRSQVKNTTIKIKKLLVNDILIEAKDFEKEILLQTKSLVYIEVPKKKIPVITKFNVSFFSISKDDEGHESFYISNEYTREL